MKALIEGQYYVLAPSGKFQVIKTIMTRLKLSDPSLAEEGYADAIKQFELKAYPSIEGLRNMQRLLQMQNPKFVDINTTNLMDSTFMRKLEDLVLSHRSRRVIGSNQVFRWATKCAVLRFGDEQCRWRCLA